MATRLLRLLAMVLGLSAAMVLAACSDLLPRNSAARATQPLKDSLVHALADIGSSPGAPMMIRIFKQSNEFEVWKATTATGEFKLLKTYKICAWSGVLGPKITEGDMQAPEGFYMITPGLMNPNSNYYLAFNTGFPNKFDTAWGRTGANLMVHGVCSSAGCYSMTDESVNEIFELARETFAGGNATIEMQAFPFRMTPQNLAAVHDNPNIPFWMQIKEGYDRFEISHTPPKVDVCDKKYVFDLSNPDGSPLNATGACPARGSDPLASQLAAKQAADAAAYKTGVAEIEAQDAKTAADKQQAADTLAAEKARGQSIGGFFSGLFGGGNPQPAAPSSELDPSTAAPTPLPAPNWG